MPTWGPFVCRPRGPQNRRWGVPNPAGFHHPSVAANCSCCAWSAPVTLPRVNAGTYDKMAVREQYRTHLSSIQRKPPRYSGGVRVGPPTEWLFISGMGGSFHWNTQLRKRYRRYQGDRVLPELDHLVPVHGGALDRNRAVALMSTGVVALVGVGLLFVAWMLDFVLPGSGIAVWSIVAAGAGCIAVGIPWDLRRVRGALSSRRGVFGIGTSVTLSLAIGTVVLANLVSTTVYHRFDFTGLKQSTLTTQTREVLAGLASEVEVVSFYTDPNPNMKDSAEIAAVNSYGFDLLKECQNYTGLMQVRREDPELRPDLARQYGISPFAAAVGTVDPDQVSEIPLNANIVVVAGPQEPYAQNEIEMLDRYVAAGGRSALLLNPNAQQELRDFAGHLWLSVDDGTVVDPPSHVSPQFRYSTGRPPPQRIRIAGGVLPWCRRDHTGRRGAGRSGVDPDRIYDGRELDRAFAIGRFSAGVRS